ncbi:MAG: phosphate-binding protein [Pirellulaceae bacterium]|nr:MAG: phosphate-binding protein [Pirellulaceae bacterium]
MARCGVGMRSRSAACRFWVVGLLAAVALSGCVRGRDDGHGKAHAASTHRDASPSRLIITGSSTLAPLVAEIARRFEQLHPDVRIEVQTGGSSRGIRDVSTGAADIAMVSRDLDESERDLTAIPIARDGVCLLIHKNNPVTSLTDEQVIGIYTGKIRHWEEVGGLPQPIVVVSKAAGRATLEVFCQYFRLREDQIRADIIIGDNQEGLKAVANHTGAIGYVSLGAAEYEAQRGLPIKLLPSRGVPATTDRLADGSFPISRTLNLVTRGEPSGWASRFISYCCSEHVHDLVEAFFFVPVVR